MLVGRAAGVGRDRAPLGPPHVHVLVRTPEHVHDVAVNAGPDVEALPIDRLERSHFASLLELDEGYHELERTPRSGALDVFRHPGLAAARGANWWQPGDVAIATLVERLLDGSERLLAFGEPFHGRRRGLHNVHLNQGDAEGSQWRWENGPWQDGGLLAVKGEGLAALLLKFADQERP